MNVTQLARARRLFCNDLTPRHVARHNQRAWVRSIRQLGSKWLLALPQQKASSVCPQSPAPVTAIGAIALLKRPETRA